MTRAGRARNHAYAHIPNLLWAQRPDDLRRAQCGGRSHCRRGKEFVPIAVVTDFHEPVFPCGACRQVLAEFHRDLEIITSTIKGRTESNFLSELLSHFR